MNATELASRIAALKELRDFPDDVVEKFSRALRDEPDEALFRMSPPAWAAANGVDEQQAIELFVTAAHVGLLDLGWGISCPLCMGLLNSPGGLKKMRGQVWCPMCQIQVPAVLDERVEVAFTVSPSVRAIRFHDLDTLATPKDLLRAYFATALAPDAPIREVFAGALLSPGRVGPGATVTVPGDLVPGWYSIFVPAGHLAFHLKVEAGNAGPEVQDVDVLEDRLVPSHGVVRAAGGKLRLRNRLSHEVGYVLTRAVAPPPDERPTGFTMTHPYRPYVSGKRLMTTQVFLDLFRAESVPAQGGLDLRGLTVLFTDLKGSTELYERVGDLRAFDLVMKHFDVLREIIARHGGAVVKTIGDAVMASFSQPLEALAAAREMQREVGKVSDEIVLKIGLHAGPCIAVQLNERLDYFGQTVNVSARVQGLAEPGEIVCTAPIYSAAGASALVESAGLRGKREAASLKGIHDEMQVLRLRPGV